MFAIVDIEGSGGSPKTARITEIAIIVHNGKRVIEQYSTLVNPETKIDPFVVALTGISDEMVEDAPTFAQIIDKIETLTKNRIIVAHNSKFDYGFIKNEYKRLGRRFQRKNLCTVQLSKKLLPGYSSYSLGKLCNSLNIPIKNRHRALGDAAATAVLLEKLLFTDKKNLIEDLLKDELNQSNLPPHLSKQEVDNLPEEVGVYYFLNEKHQPIYIGKSKNIRSRIRTHFLSDSQSKRFHELKQEIHSIDVQLTGSELLAEVIESGEIKRFMPKFNRAQRRKKYRYGVFINVDEQGYQHLEAKLLNHEEQPILKFKAKKWAEAAISQLNKTHHLRQETRLQYSPEEYNLKVAEAVANYHYEYSNFLLIDEGRNFHEKAILRIKDGFYYGYALMDEDQLQTYDVASIIAAIPKDFPHPDKDQIIRKYLKKKNRLELFTYNPTEMVE